MRAKRAGKKGGRQGTRCDVACYCVGFCTRVLEVWLWGGARVEKEEQGIKLQRYTEL
jgi:hypothetical protein